jgi:hypothetical protein
VGCQRNPPAFPSIEMNPYWVIPNRMRTAHCVADFHHRNGYLLRCGLTTNNCQPASGPAQRKVPQCPACLAAMSKRRPMPKIKSIHPFPARMGMDIVWEELETFEAEHSQQTMKTKSKKSKPHRPKAKPHRPNSNARKTPPRKSFPQRLEAARQSVTAAHKAKKPALRPPPSDLRPPPQSLPFHAAGQGLPLFEKLTFKAKRKVVVKPAQRKARKK